MGTRLPFIVSHKCMGETAVRRILLLIVCLFNSQIIIAQAAERERPSPNDGSRPAETALKINASMGTRESNGVRNIASIPYDKFVLKNGLRVIVHEDRKAPIVAVGVWYDVGSKDEPIGRSGFAHLFEHIMFNGAKHYDGDYFQPLEEAGASDINGNASFDFTAYYQTVPTGALERALWLESDRMGYLLGALTQAKLEEQRAVVKSEKKLSDNQPFGMAQYSLLAGVFEEGHPYSLSPIGSEDDLDDATLDDARSWFETFYGASNAVLVMAGDLDLETGRRLAEKYFGAMPPGASLERPVMLGAGSAQDKHEVIYDQTPYAQFYKVWQTPGLPLQQSAHLELAARILGNGPASRLHRRLVEEAGIAYDARVITFPLKFATPLGVVVTADVAARGDAKTVAAGVVRAFLQNGPLEEELVRAKREIYTEFLSGLERVGGLTGKVATLASGELLVGDPAFLTARMEWINDATTEDVRIAASEWLTAPAYRLDILPLPAFSAQAEAADRQGYPDTDETAPFVFPDTQTISLQNGLEATILERPRSPLLQVAVQFDMGAAEDGGTRGLSDLLLHAMVQGKTKKGVSLQSSFAELAVRYDIETGADGSSITFTATRDAFEELITLIKVMLAHATFTTENVDVIRAKRWADIQQRNTDPKDLGQRLLVQFTNGHGTAYGHPPFGTESSLADITASDLRDHYANHIGPHSLRVVIVGAVDALTVQKKLVPVLGKLRVKEKPSTSVPAAARMPTREKQLILLDRPGATQSAIFAGAALPVQSPTDIAGLHLISDVLGGLFTSRLNLNLREQKGWTYGVQGTVIEQGDAALLSLYSSVQRDHTWDAIAEMEKELREIKDERPITVVEIGRATANRVQALAGRFETSEALTEWIMMARRLSLPLRFHAQLAQQYKEQTPQTLSRIARQKLNPKTMTWIVVGDLNAVTPTLRTADFTSIIVINADGDVLERLKPE